MLTAYFYHKTTGLPLTDTNVTVSVTLANMNNDTKVLDNVQMSPSSSFPGAFRNSYAIDREIDYMAHYSCSDSNYITSVDKLYIPSSGKGGGGFSINYQAINSHTTNKVNELREEFTKLPTVIEKGFNETNSHIEVAKTDLSDKIESIDIPEAILEEKEAKKAIKLIQGVDKKLTAYIDSETSEKEELGAITREFTRQELEDEMNKKKHEEERKRKEEQEKKMEEEADKKLLEEIKKEFDIQEEQEKEEKRKELEKELEELEKEKKEKEKELNSIK